MKYLVIILLFMSLLGLKAHAQQAYKFGAGDEIEIVVFGQPDLHLKTLLSIDGNINYRFVGAIKAVGLTKKQLEDMIYQGLKGDYLVNPTVSVSIVKYRNIYVHGEVKKPGGYPYEPGLNINKAISLAGGFTERAAKDKLFLVAETDVEANKKMVNLSSSITPGDTLYIEKRFF